MSLLPLPDQKETVIVVGTTCRKPLPVLRAYLQSLDWQRLPDRTRLHFVFTPDFTADQQDAKTHLQQWVTERNGELLRGHAPNQADFAEGPQYDAHQWTPSSMARVGQHKNLILRRAQALHADYVFFADADLILGPETIASLLACEKPVTTAVYWTKWSKRGTETRQVHAAPQVWLRHPYALDGRGMDEATFRTKLVNRELTRVWGFGACTLIHRSVIDAGISFDYLPDVPLQGLMAGEDRHFCLRCERQHIEAYADPWPDIFHIYHAEDQQRIGEMIERFQGIRRQVPQMGDWVNVRLRALEPIPVGPGRFQQVPPQIVRGRLGGITLLPDLEEAIATMAIGETRIVRSHFPVTYPAAWLRGRIRLIEVTLIDVKPSGTYPPNLEDEVYTGPKSGATLDGVTLFPAQHESIREVASE